MSVVVSLIWLIAALALAGAEVLTGDLYLLMLGGGALAAAGSSLVFDQLWLHGAVFLGSSVLLLFLVRPALRRRMLRNAPAETGIRALEGRDATVLEPVARDGGQVRLGGEVWTARPLNDDDKYQAGEQVTVVRIDGATAVVWRDL